MADIYENMIIFYDTPFDISRKKIPLTFQEFEAGARDRRVFPAP